MAQWVKDPVLSLLWLRFAPWPGNFCMSQVWPPKKKKWRSLVLQQVKDLTCHCSGLDHCCGTGLIPGPGISTCSQAQPKKKKKKVLLLPKVKQSGMRTLINRNISQ